MTAERLQQGKALANPVLKGGTPARRKKAIRMDYNVSWFSDLSCRLMTYASAFLNAWIWLHTLVC